MEGALSRLRQFLAPPTFADEDKTRTARLLHITLVTLTIVAVCITALLPILYDKPGSFNALFTMAGGAGIAVLCVGLLLLVRRGHLQAASIVLLAALWGMMTYWVASVAGISSDTSTLTYALAIALAGQQVTGVQQIAGAMEDIHRVTAQSVANAQQVEKTAGELHQLAGRLRELVGQYRL